MPDHAGVPRILLGTAADMELQVYVAGVATAPDAVPAPRVTITSEGGTVIASDVVASPGIVATKVKHTLTAAQLNQVNFLTAVWTLEMSDVAHTLTTYAQVVRELLFTLADARAYYGAVLGSSTTYPDATLIQMRDQITDAFADILGRSVGGHYGREILDGDGTTELELASSRLTSVLSLKARTFGSQTYTAFTAGELADVLVERSGRLTRESLGVFEAGRQNIAVEYEHGLSPIPYELKQAALRVARHFLVKSDLPDRATSQTNEHGVMSFLSVAGKPGQWFGIPDVDAALSRYRRKLPGIG